MIRPESRWWLLTLAVVAVLVGISFLALDRPDVVWSGGEPYCPHCRSGVEAYATRCAQCDQPFDWSATPDADSPLSTWSLTALEAEVLRDRVQALGEEEAQRRAALALSITPEAAERYLATVGRGRCGWCGGTGEDLGDGDGPGEGPCPVCFGRKWCIACGGDRRIRLGDPAAGRAFETYAQGLRDITPTTLPQPVQQAEARRLNEAFIARHTGTVEATYLVFWPRWRAAEALATPDADTRVPGLRAVEVARRRLDAVLEALASE